MRQYIFEKNFPSLQYIFLRWPKSKDIILKYSLFHFKKPDFFKLSIICMKELQIDIKNPLYFPLSKLAILCSKNVNSNKYHDQHHFKSVLLIACLFAKISKIKRNERLLIIILALVHDMNHQGKRIVNKPYYQEKKTIQALEKVIYRKLLNNKIWKRINRILLNTYFPIEPEKNNDLVEKIILNADLAGSLIFGFRNGLKLAEKLKNEISYKNKSLTLYKDFLEKIETRRLDFFF